MKRFLCALAVAVLTLYVAQAFRPASSASAQQTWTGVISDNSCRGKHEAGGEAGLPEGDGPCTLACIRGGSKFVLVSDGKLYLIAKQDDPALVTHAGEKVRVTGALQGDVLTVASIQKEK
jgi:hypothetical protein